MRISASNELSPASGSNRSTYREIISGRSTWDSFSAYLSPLDRKYLLVFSELLYNQNNIVSNIFQASLFENCKIILYRFKKSITC